MSNQLSQNNQANQANELYRKIRIALYTKQIRLKDIAQELGVTSATFTRTIQGQQWNLKVINWVKENLNIKLPIRRNFHITASKKEQKKKRIFNPEFKKYFTPKEAEFYYGLSCEFLATQRYKKIGIPYFKLGKKVLYAKEDLENYIKQQSVKISVYQNSSSLMQNER